MEKTKKRNKKGENIMESLVQKMGKLWQAYQKGNYTHIEYKGGYTYIEYQPSLIEQIINWGLKLFQKEEEKMYLKLRKINLAEEDWIEEAIENGYTKDDLNNCLVEDETNEGSLDGSGRVELRIVGQYIHGRFYKEEMSVIINEHGMWVEDTLLG